MIFFFFGRGACGILLPRPAIEPMSPAVEAQIPNHWTARVFQNPNLKPSSVTLDLTMLNSIQQCFPSYLGFSTRDKVIEGYKIGIIVSV